MKDALFFFFFLQCNVYNTTLFKALVTIEKQQNFTICLKILLYLQHALIQDLIFYI